MENISTHIYVIVSLILLTSCTQKNSRKNSDTVNNPTYGIWQNLSETPLKFELEQTFGNNEGIMFPSTYQLIGPVADDKGNVYVIDGQNGSLYSFDQNGNIRWKKGEKGKGPGDFQRPKGLVTDGEYLYTANVSGSRIDQFDLEGNLINSNSLESLDLSFTTVEGFISDSLLVTTSTVWGKLGEKVIVLNTADELKKVSEFEIIVAPSIELGKGLSSGVSVQIVDSLIAAGNLRDYNIPFYNSNGNIVKTISRDFDKLVRPGYSNSTKRRTIRTFGGLGAPLLLPNGYYLTTLSWPINVDDPDQFLKKSANSSENTQRPIFKNSIDLYDMDGTLLYSLEEEGRIPDIGTISFVDTKGNIYTKANEPFPQLRRYSLTINKPED